MGHYMNGLKVAPSAAVLLGLATLLSCTDLDRDEKKANTSKVASAGQAPAQQKPEEKDADEDEEGAPNPVAAKAEQPAPLQT